MNNKIPSRLKWQGTTYTFLRNKGNTIVYENNPIDHYDGSNGDIIVVEYRPHKMPKDRFYVLYSIEATAHFYVGGHSAYIKLPNITGKNRMAIPIWD